MAKVIENKVDMQNLISPPNDHKPKTVKHNILGDMLDEIVASDQFQSPIV